MNWIRRLIDSLTYPIRALMYLPRVFFSPARKLACLSLPARIAWLVALFLVISTITAFVGFYVSADRAPWNYWVRPIRLATIALLLVLIPWLVYQVLRLWLEGERSLFPDIDYAWRAGLEELARCDIDLAQVPVFLVLGTSSPESEKGVFDASRLSLRIREFPEGPAALHWYANPDGVFLCATDASCLSKLDALGREVMRQERAGPIPVPAGGLGIRGTIVAGEVPSGGGSPSAEGPAPSPDIRGTMVVGSAAPGEVEPSAVAEKRTIAMSPAETSLQEQRLRYVCGLLRRARRPFCAVNGILTVLSYPFIKRGPREGIEVQRAVRRDLETARSGLQLRCPITAMVGGMEQEPGFQELVRRVGRDRATAQRFGRGFPVWKPPLAERMEALASHACGAFEDWVYALFREPQALAKPGNTKLYALLCQIRRHFKRRLENILVAGYSCPDERTDAAMLFGGCYFAATGPTEDRQAFVRGVLDKLPEQQEELEWTDEALGEDLRHRRLAQAGLMLDTVLLIALGGLIAGKWFL